MIDRILLGRNSKGLEQLKWMDARAVAELIRLEHPQIIAIMMSFSNRDQAAGCWPSSPSACAATSSCASPRLDGIQPTALEELDDIMERQFAGNANVQSSALGGIKAAANILNCLERRDRGRVMEQILAPGRRTSRRRSRTRCSSSTTSPRSTTAAYRRCCARCATDQLLLALRGADDELKAKIFKNMSQRAAEMLREDLAAAARHAWPTSRRRRRRSSPSPVAWPMRARWRWEARVEKPTSKVIRDGLAAQVVSWSPPLIGTEADDLVAADELDVVEVTDVALGELRHASVSALPTAAELERLHKKAYDDGFERGRAEGLRYGHQEALEAARTQIAERIALLDELLDALATPFRRLDDRVEREVVSLVVAIVRQLVRREVRTDPGQIVGVVREALGILPVASRNVRVVLHPEDAALVRAGLRPRQTAS